MQLMLPKYLLLTAALSISALARSQAAPGGDPSIQLFLGACATTYARASEVAGVAREFGLSELTDADAAPYLRGQRGRAWGGEIASKPYVVAVQPNGLCTVFVHEGDATLIQSAVESWLPPAESGIAVTKEGLESPPGLASTSYELRGGRVQERWVVTVSTIPASSMRAILSWNRL